MRQSVDVERSLDHVIGRVEQRPTRGNAGVVHQHGDLEFQRKKRVKRNSLHLHEYI